MTDQSDELIYGKNAVLSFLEQEGAVNKIFFSQAIRGDSRLDRIRDLARQAKVPIVNADPRKLDQMAGKEARHQGVIAQISPAAYWSMDDLLKLIDKDCEERQSRGQTMDGYLLAILDGIEDPHNLGAIVRVAEAVGVQAILVPARRSAGLTQVVAKTSAGALASLPIVRIGNTVRAMESLKTKGFWIAGLDLEGTQTIFEADLRRPLAIVIGSEGQGMGRLVRENCDFLLKIPMVGKVESLNASVAAGVCFFEAFRQNSLGKAK